MSPGAALPVPDSARRDGYLQPEQEERHQVGETSGTRVEGPGQDAPEGGTYTCPGGPSEDWLSYSVFTVVTKVRIQCFPAPKTDESKLLELPQTGRVFPNRPVVPDAR